MRKRIVALVVFLCCAPLMLLMLVASAEARYCSSPSCAMCARLFGPLPGFEQRPLTKIDSTPHDAVKVMVAALELTPKDLLYDIGCGDGRVLVEAVRQSGCRAVGIEIDPRVAEIARENARQSGVGHLIRITTGDALRYNRQDRHPQFH